MTIEEIKSMAYHEEEPGGLDICETLLYLESAAIYKMYRNGFYDEKTAKQKITRAVGDYKAIKILSECFDRAMEREKQLEHLKGEYNKTKSPETAVKIAEAIIGI